jgi:hypothetical protein
MILPTSLPRNLELRESRQKHTLSVDLHAKRNPLTARGLRKILAEGASLN